MALSCDGRPIGGPNQDPFPASARARARPALPAAHPVPYPEKGVNARHLLGNLPRVTHASILRRCCGVCVPDGGFGVLAHGRPGRPRHTAAHARATRARLALFRLSRPGASAAPPLSASAAPRHRREPRTAMAGGKRIALFDVDGTLSKPRGKATPEMLAFMQELRKVVTVGIVGGSDLKKIKEQIGDSVTTDYDYVFSENGLMAHKVRREGGERRACAGSRRTAARRRAMLRMR